MRRTYARFASPPARTATSNAGDGGGVIAAKDRPGNLTGASDQQVVAWAKQGYETAFRELVRRYERPLFSLLYRMVRDRALAEDLAQETFIKVLNGIGSYNPQFKFSSWIFKIANNAAIDHLRKRELDTLSLDGSPNAATPQEMQATALQLGDRAESPLQELEARELGGTSLLTRPSCGLKVSSPRRGNCTSRSAGIAVRWPTASASCSASWRSCRASRRSSASPSG